MTDEQASSVLSISLIHTPTSISFCYRSRKTRSATFSRGHWGSCYRSLFQGDFQWVQSSTIVGREASRRHIAPVTTSIFPAMPRLFFWPLYLRGQTYHRIFERCDLCGHHMHRVLVHPSPRARQHCSVVPQFLRVMPRRHPTPSCEERSDCALTYDWQS